MMYGEFPFVERIAAAAADGFHGVECQFPYEVAPKVLARALRDANVQMVLINTPPGDMSQGDRGLAVDPARKPAFRSALLQSIEYAVALDVPHIHVMAGVVPAHAEAARVRDTFVQNLAWAAEQLKGANKCGLLEPINTRDIPGYFLNHQSKAHAIVQAIGSPHLGVQMDLYHLQIVEGDLVTKLQHFLPTGRVKHIQFAGVPARAEPDAGELNFTYLFEQIEALGYAGWLGAEYRPAAQTRDGLGWFAPYRDLKQN